MKWLINNVFKPVLGKVWAVVQTVFEWVFNDPVLTIVGGIVTMASAFKIDSGDHPWAFWIVFLSGAAITAYGLVKLLGVPKLPASPIRQGIQTMATSGKKGLPRFSWTGLAIDLCCPWLRAFLPSEGLHPPWYKEAVKYM